MSKPTVRWREESIERDRERLRNQSALNRLTSRDREPKQAPVRRGYDPRSEDEQNEKG